GHAGGDELLKQFSDTLARPVRRDDTLARLEGDEFGILLNNCSLDHASDIAQGISSNAQGYKFLWGDRTLSVSASIGLVMIEPSSPTITELLKISESACRDAKAQGGQRLQIASPQDVNTGARKGETRWVVSVQEALEAKRFELHVQPIVPIGHEGGAKRHYEILLRMKTEDGKLVLPGMFFPVAERYKLAGQIDRLVIEMLAERLNEDPTRRMASAMYSVNLSGQSLGDEQFQNYAIRILKESEISPDCICFEITETAAVANMANAMRFIHTLSDVGCRFALDDFGSGLCSFSYLKSFPVHFLKIDGIFVKDIVTDPIDRAMVRSINDIGRVMGKQTVAEFVESDIILQVLREIGVDFAQGFAVGRPTPLDMLDTLS
ncbi:MAG TPA: EAL domain-containing protein, partial [Gammaproteobacteria bacterium]